MGIKGGLGEIFSTAGRKVDLRSFTRGIRHSTSTNDMPKPLRIGVDISMWTYSAENQFSDVLGEENDETGRLEQDLKYVQLCTDYVMNRLEALRNSTQSEILAVFDGATPPCKQTEVSKRRNRQVGYEKQRAGRHRTGVYTSTMEALRDKEIAFLVAPYESDGQLAFLSLEGYIDLIVTEDSDLVAYGASPIMYKIKESNVMDGIPKGILVCKEDLAANTRSLNLLDFSSAMLSVLFVATGCDYWSNLEGIGVKTACKIVREAFFSGHDDRLAKVFEGLFKKAPKRASFSDEFKEHYKRGFLEALLAFRHPVIFDPVERCCYSYGVSGNGACETEAELLTHVPYAELVNDATRREGITGKIMHPLLATIIAEGYVCPRSQRPRTSMIIPEYVKAELVKLRLWDYRTENNDYQYIRRESTRRTLPEATLQQTGVSSNSRTIGRKRKNMDDSNKTYHDEDSEDDHYYIDSQEFETQPRSINNADKS